MLARENPGVINCVLVSVTVWVQSDICHGEEISVGEGFGKRTSNSGTATRALTLVVKFDGNFIGSSSSDGQQGDSNYNFKEGRDRITCCSQQYNQQHCMNGAACIDIGIYFESDKQEKKEAEEHCDGVQPRHTSLIGGHMRVDGTILDDVGIYSDPTCLIPNC